VSPRAQFVFFVHVICGHSCNLQQVLESSNRIWFDFTAPLNRFYVLWRHRNHRRIIIIIVITELAEKAYCIARR